MRPEQADFLINFGRYFEVNAKKYRICLFGSVITLPDFETREKAQELADEIMRYAQSRDSITLTQDFDSKKYFLRVVRGIPEEIVGG